MERYNPMSIMTAAGGCTTEESEFDLTMGETIPILHSFNTNYRFCLACYRMGSGESLRLIKSQGLELVHARLGVKVKDPWSCTSTPPHILMTWCSIEHRKNFILTLLFTRQIFLTYKSL
jgi:hypothetical protein